eukprot:SAG22_NODE_3607_length_1618_cov_1.930876_2_plen_90_part_00
MMYTAGTSIYYSEHGCGLREVMPSGWICLPACSFSFARDGNDDAERCAMGTQHPARVLPGSRHRGGRGARRAFCPSNGRAAAAVVGMRH